MPRNHPNVSRRSVLAAASLAIPLLARAQAYPAQPVRIVVPYPAGGGADAVARMLAQHMSIGVGQSFVVENRPGASGIIGNDYVAKSAKDGYTLLYVGMPFALSPALVAKLPYRTVEDFSPVGLICTVPTLLVVDANLPIKSVADLLSYAKAKGHISYGYGSSTAQIGGAALTNVNKLNATGVGYKSSTLALTDVVGGQTAFMFIDIGASQALVQAGRVRPIAVANEERSALVPDLPPIAATPGMAGFELTGWASMAGPVGMPAEIVNRLNAEMNRILKRKDINDKLLGIGCEVATTTPDEFGRYIQKQIASYAQKVREAGVQPQ